MKEKIKFLIKESGPKSFKQARKELGIKGYDDSKTLDKVLRELVKDKVLFYKKSTDTYQFKDKKEVIGTFFETRQDFGFVEVDGGESYFIPAKFVLNALHGDSVRILVLPSQIEGKGDIGKIVRVMKRNGNNLVGTVFSENGNKLIEIADISSKHPHVITNASNVKDGDVVVCKFLDFSEHQIKVKVIDNLGPQKSNND
jgi:exoribonuclease R